MSFFAGLEAKRGLAEAAVARELLGWARVQMPRLTWGKGKVAVYTYGRLENF